MDAKMKIAVGAAVAALMVGGVGVAVAQTGRPGNGPASAAPQVDQPPAAVWARGGMVGGVVKQIDGTVLVVALPGAGGLQDARRDGTPALPDHAKGRQGPFNGQPGPGAPGRGQRGQPQQAQPDQPAPPIKPITATGDVRVQTDANTAFYAPGVSTATLADVKVGDRVGILITRPVDKTAPVTTTLLAKAVAVLPQLQSVELMGTANAVSAAGFSLTGPRGANLGQVKVVATTKFVLAGDPSAPISALKDNDPVLVIAKPAGDQTFEASLIIDQPMSRTANFAGFVAAVNGDTLVVWGMGGQSLSVNATNAIFVKGQDVSGTIADVKPGMSVRVIGAGSGATVTAQVITAGPGLGAGMGGKTPARPGTRMPGRP